MKPAAPSSGVEYLCAHLPCQRPILSYVFCALQLHTGYCIQVQTSKTGRFPAIQILELKEQVKLNFPNKTHSLRYWVIMDVGEMAACTLQSLQLEKTYSYKHTLIFKKSLDMLSKHGNTWSGRTALERQRQEDHPKLTLCKKHPRLA